MLLSERMSDHPLQQPKTKQSIGNKSIAIIRAGPTGVYTLLELVRSNGRLFIAIFEKSNMAGVGMPYSPNKTVREPSTYGTIRRCGIAPRCTLRLPFI
ncbi:FAD/NAD(P)-binding protein [Loktanella salsilacus]|nr:FAD/NAD(P)-binding protein [Loktanella salsilacus]